VTDSTGGDEEDDDDEEEEADSVSSLRAGNPLFRSIMPHQHFKNEKRKEMRRGKINGGGGKRREGRGGGGTENHMCSFVPRFRLSLFPLLQTCAMFYNKKKCIHKQKQRKKKNKTRKTEKQKKRKRKKMKG
jgi:hypothetical protein